MGKAAGRRGLLGYTGFPYATGKYREKSLSIPYRIGGAAGKSLICNAAAQKFPRRANRELNHPNREENQS